jgi:hypothetical protein
MAIPSELLGSVSFLSACALVLVFTNVPVFIIADDLYGEVLIEQQRHHHQLEGA